MRMRFPATRDVFHDHGEQHHVLMQHMVVLQVVQQRGGHTVRIGGHEYAGAVDPVRRIGCAGGAERWWARRCALPKKDDRG
jgi:hypothetical protein